MQVLDASSIVYAWDNYPIEVFPRLWDWIAAEIQEENLTMCCVSFDEVEHVAPDCAAWLHAQNLKTHDIGNEIAARALAIKGELGIVADDYHQDGVDENDILAIATAGVHGVSLVSDEAKQPNLPLNKKRYKIPAVCQISTVATSCLSFLDLVKAAGQPFG
jgi:hypothetical protein